jgi:hypothetical protein
LKEKADKKYRQPHQVGRQERERETGRRERDREKVNWRRGNQPGGKQNKSVVDVKELQETIKRKML